MIALYWLRSLFRVAPGRTLATAAGIALAVAFAATLAIFVISASYTMTARAIANVPVDWQVELGPGIDRTAVETALDQAGAAKLVRPVEYARVDGFAATTGDTQQVTGPGQAIGIPPDYLTAFPNQVTLLSGSFDGPVLYSQTAANLHAGVGDEISVNRPGLAPTTVRVAGVAAIPNVDSLFQAIGAPAGLAPQSPPDNILILPIATWRSIFDPQRAAKPETVRTQLHVLLDRARLPADPVGAYQAVRQMANNVEARICRKRGARKQSRRAARRGARRRALRQGVVPLPRRPGRRARRPDHRRYCRGRTRPPHARAGAPAHPRRDPDRDALQSGRGGGRHWTCRRRGRFAPRLYRVAPDGRERRRADCAWLGFVRGCGRPRVCVRGDRGSGRAGRPQF